MIPPRKHRCTKPRVFDTTHYRERHRIEFFFGKFRRFRRVATRYDKHAANLASAIGLAAVTAVWR